MAGGVVAGLGRRMVMWFPDRLSGTANLFYLAATGAGQLAIVAVLTALYPAVTVLLARLTLHERWSRLQAIGLITAAVAVAAISIG